MDRKDIHNKAWGLLEEKGLNLGERMMVRSSFIEWSGYKEEYPFILSKINKSGYMDYYSGYEKINSFVFKSEKEVILANAIYLNTNESLGIDEFIQIFKYTCKIIGIDSDWL